MSSTQDYKSAKNEVYFDSSNDSVNHPAHYLGKVEVIDYIDDKLTQEQFEGYLVGNIIKYISRYQKKNGTEDLLKGRWYLNKLIEMKDNNNE